MFGLGVKGLGVWGFRAKKREFVVVACSRLLFGSSDSTFIAS